MTAREEEVLRKLELWDRILRASVPDRHKGATSPVGAVQNYIGELEAERDKLREALTPFADVAPHYEGTRDDYVVIRHIGESGDHPLVVADFRRALSLKETAP